MWKYPKVFDMIEEYEETGYNVGLIDPTEENVKRHGKGNPPPIVQKPKFSGTINDSMGDDVDVGGE